MKRKIALGLAATTVLSLGGGAYAYAQTTPAAYVSVDINPSLELGVNSFGKVISAQAYNEDGQKVLEGTNLVNFDVEKAVSTVISNAISDGYIKEDVTTTSAVAVEITTSTDKEKMATELDESLKEAADKTLKDNNVNAEAESENVALARRDEARQLGITPGKLNLIQKLQALDPTIKVEDYKSSSVKDIQKKFKELNELKKGDETTTGGNTATDTNSNTTTDTSANVNNGTSSNVNTDLNSNTNAETSAVTGSNTQEATVSQESDENDKSSHEDKDNNGINKKEDKDNDKEENSNNSIKSQDNNSSKAKSNGNSNAQDKGNSKGKGTNN